MNIVIVAGVLITVLTCIPVLWQLRGHPRGLFVLFFAEMWERFSFYGLRALLILYLTKHFLFSDKAAGAQYGAYTTLVYLLPLAGGVLADRYLGTRKAVAFGALLLVAGQLSMAVQGRPAEQILTYHSAQYGFQSVGVGDQTRQEIVVAGKPYAYGADKTGGIQVRGLPAASPLPALLPAGSYALSVKPQSPLYLNFMYFALSLIVVGVGFLKPNISSIVGQLYAQGDPRRDSGFTLYYFGINLGSFWAAILCGYLGQTVGWWAGFGLGGLGMLAGFVVFVIGRDWLEGRGEAPRPAELAKSVAGPITRETLIYGGGFASVGLIFLLIRHNDIVGYMLGAGSLAVLGYVGWHMATKATKVERERLGLALALIVGAVVFFTLFEQAGSSLQSFTDRNVDLNIARAPITFPLFGQQVFIGSRAMLAAAPAVANRFWVDLSLSSAQTQSFNPGFILIFAPIFAALWAFLGRRNRDPNPMIKFGLALLQVGLGFLVLVWGAQFADANYRVPVTFLAMAYLLHTTGEMCLSPVGLSEITKLSPMILTATMMATWFLAISWAEWIGGLIAQFAGTETVAGQVLDPAKALATSIHVFGIIGLAAVGAGVLFLIVSPWLSRWANGVNDAANHVAPEPIAATVDGERQAVSLGVMQAEREA